jgi:hypothetical protein
LEFGPPPSDVQQLQTVREATLQANPDLAAEYKGIVDEMQAQQAKIEAAMVKADPKVAPIVAKLAAMRQSSMPHPPAIVPGSK